MLIVATVMVPFASTDPEAAVVATLVNVGFCAPASPVDGDMAWTLADTTVDPIEEYVALHVPLVVDVTGMSTHFSVRVVPLLLTFSTPVAPVAPVAPVLPVVPVEPVLPVAPVGPVAPAGTAAQASPTLACVPFINCPAGHEYEY